MAGDWSKHQRTSHSFQVSSCIQTGLPLMTTVQLFLKENVISKTDAGLNVYAASLDAHLCRRLHTFKEEVYPLLAFSARIRASTFSNVTVLPVNAYGFCTFQRGFWLPNLIAPLEVLTLHKPPPDGRGCVFNSAQLLHVSSAFRAPMHTCYAEIRFRCVHPVVYRAMRP